MSDIKALQITPGPWGVVENYMAEGDFHPHGVFADFAPSGHKMPAMADSPANANLIAEAGTVANETGKTPRQLADENAKLREACEALLTEAKAWDGKRDWRTFFAWDGVHAALTGATP